METRDVKRLISAILHKWWLIALFAALCGGAAGYVSIFRTTPMYKAETTLYIINREKTAVPGQKLNSEDMKISEQLVLNYMDVIYSRKIMSAAVKDLNDPRITESAVASMISLNNNKDSNILTLRAVWTDPKIAASVANALSDQFAGEIRQMTNSDYVGVLDYALAPEIPLPQPHGRNILLGLVFGGFLALGCIYAIEFFNTSVRSADDIEAGLKLRVVGMIPEHDIL